MTQKRKFQELIKCISVGSVCLCSLSLCVSHLLFGDADVAQVRLKGFVRLLGEHPVAVERLTKHRLQEEVRLLGIIHHNDEERHRHDQTGGDQRLPLWRDSKRNYD